MRRQFLLRDLTKASVSSVAPAMPSSIMLGRLVQMGGHRALARLKYLGLGTTLNISRSPASHYYSCMPEPLPTLDTHLGAKPRTLVLCFDGTTNVYNDNVSELSA